ncbi:MAG: MFS transporter [Bacilli bacterium]|nr:MFS transporter [Bacilli bacterium]
MFSFLLLLIYLVFISLGLPDTALGSAWPSIYPDLDVPVSYASILTVIVPLCTIISSLNSDRLTRKFGTAKVVAFSVLLSALGLIGYSISSKFWMLCVFAVPYGLGAGGIDSAVNNYAASNYSSKHMNWLHAMWGIGATVGPLIMGCTLSSGSTWNTGYLILGIIQSLLLIVLFITLPLWKNTSSKEDNINNKSLTIKQTLMLKGAFTLLLCFFCYSAVEQTIMLWCGSYLVLHLSISEEIAASFSSLFVIGMTIGRIISGFVSTKLNEKQMIRLGSIFMIIGLIMMIINLGTIVSFVGICLLGLGCAPIYPSIVHSIPVYFGKDKSQGIIGIQMAFAYLGIVLMPSLFGLIVEFVGIYFLSIYLLIFTVLMIVLHEILVKQIKVS